MKAKTILFKKANGTDDKDIYTMLEHHYYELMYRTGGTLPENCIIAQVDQQSQMTQLVLSSKLDPEYEIVELDDLVARICEATGKCDRLKAEVGTTLLKLSQEYLL